MDIRELKNGEPSSGSRNQGKTSWETFDLRCWSEDVDTELEEQVKGNMK